MAWAVSGSVGLELMVEALPSVVLYKIRPFDLWVARFFIKSRFISLVNLLADAEVMPEYLTAQDVSGDLANWAESWLNDPAKREQAVSAARGPAQRVAVPRASERAADQIVKALETTRPRDSSTIRGTHGTKRIHRGHASR